MKHIARQLDLSDSNDTEIPKMWVYSNSIRFFWWPQLLKLDTACRIPSDTLTLPDTKNEEYLQECVDGIHTDLPTFRYRI